MNLDGLDAVWSVAGLTRDFFGMDAIDRSEHRLEIRSRQCPLWEAAKRLREEGLTPDAFCRPHEAFYQGYLRDLGSPVHFRFVAALGRGDAECHWLAELPEEGGR